MLYRVDYTLALLLAGAIVTVVAGRWRAAIDGARVARGYLVATAAIVAVRVVVLVARDALGVTWIPDLVGPLAGDLGVVLVGAIYGLAVLDRGRGDAAAVLRAPELRFALCLSAGIGFVLTVIGSARSIEFMRGFFTESGYSHGFLYFIMAIELLGGIALVLPWRWLVLAAVAGLAIDMFGAVYTHLHNGDPLDDSTGAIGQLLRLAPLAVLTVKGRRARVAVGLAAVGCAALAAAGSALIRRDAAVAAAAPADELTYFVGDWGCAGAFASGVAIAADLHAERVAGGSWLLVRHDDRPPHGYHALAEWSHGRAGWIASWQDAGGARAFHATGWQADQLVWEGGSNGARDQRFLYRRIDDATLEIGYETGGPAAWRRIDTLTCRRGRPG